MLGKEGFVNFLKEFNKARQKHYETGEVQYIPAVATDNKPAAMTGDEPFAYYGTSRAWSSGWVNRYTTESIENLMSYNAIPYAHHVSPMPLVVVHGKNDKYCFPKFAQQVYDEAGIRIRIPSISWILIRFKKRYGDRQKIRYVNPIDNTNRR